MLARSSRSAPSSDNGSHKILARGGKVFTGHLLSDGQPGRPPKEQSMKSLADPPRSRRGQRRRASAGKRSLNWRLLLAVGQHPPVFWAAAAAAPLSIELIQAASPTAARIIRPDVRNSLPPSIVDRRPPHLTTGVRSATAPRPRRSRSGRLDNALAPRAQRPPSTGAPGPMRGPAGVDPLSTSGPKNLARSPRSDFGEQAARSSPPPRCSSSPWSSRRQGKTSAREADGRAKPTAAPPKP